MKWRVIVTMSLDGEREESTITRKAVTDALAGC